MGAETVETTIPVELESARRRIGEEGARAPASWRVAFDELAVRLFDPDFSLQQLRRARGLRAACHSESFRACFGCAPGEYVGRWRVQTAVRLLGRRELEIGQVAQLVGFSSRRSFEKAVRRLCGLSPAALRERMTGTGETPEEPAAVRSRQLLGLALEPSEAAAEIRRLRRLRQGTPAPHAPGIQGFESQVAEQWWRFLRELSDGERRRALRGALFETPALFEHLSRASREEGRENRQHGIELAELALDSLRPLRGRLEPARLAELEARAWAYLGNAFALALDYPAAGRAFQAAHRCLVGHPIAAVVEAEVLYLRSVLCRFERRLGEARQLADRAVALCPPGRSRLRAEVLLGRGNVCWLSGEHAAAHADFKTALEALDPETEPYLACVATLNVSDSLCRLGEHEQASCWLARAEPLARRLGQRLPLCHILWLGGLLAIRFGRLEQGARSLREAYVTLQALGERGYAAIAALDLAEIEGRAGRSEEALELIAHALPMLETLGLEAESMSALELLRRILETRQLGAASLAAPRATLGRSVGALCL